MIIFQKENFRRTNVHSGGNTDLEVLIPLFLGDFHLVLKNIQKNIFFSNNYFLPKMEEFDILEKKERVLQKPIGLGWDFYRASKPISEMCAISKYYIKFRNKNRFIKKLKFRLDGGF